AGERQMHAVQRSDHTCLQHSGRMLQRVDQFFRAFESLPPLANAAMDDFLEMIAAREMTHLARADTRARVALDQDPQQLPDLVDVVSRLPFRPLTIDDVAGRVERVQGANRDAAAVALLPRDAEVAKLQAAALADEDVQRRQVAVQHLTAMQLVEDL